MKLKLTKNYYFESMNFIYRQTYIFIHPPILPKFIINIKFINWLSWQYMILISQIFPIEDYREIK